MAFRIPRNPERIHETVYLGSGTRLKLLEVFAMGIPAVATRLGAEGIDCVDGEPILLADDAPGLARQLTRLLSDETLHARLSRSARELALRQCDWERIGHHLLQVYGDVDPPVTTRCRG
jgi:glycosyltransferase involved in cell wall biosynthesis